MGEIKPHYSNNRSILADVIPLDKPYSIQIEPSQVCNLKCKYCMQHLIPDHPTTIMTMETFGRVADQIAEFGGVKQINFAGWGEPLVNKRLPGMIKILKDRKVAENVAVVTNGLLINPTWVFSLVDAGLDHIRISLQGMDWFQYANICGRLIDWDVFLDNLTFLYKNKGQCKVSVKVADIGLRKGDKKLFYDTFGPISDQMFIETIRPMFKEGGNGYQGDEQIRNRTPSD